MEIALILASYYSFGDENESINGWTDLGEEDVPLVECIYIYIVFTRVPGKSYRRRHRSLLLCLCYDVFRELIKSFVC